MDHDAPPHVLIGGGSGFIGFALAVRLRARGDRVTLLSRMVGPDLITWDELVRNGLPTCHAAVKLGTGRQPFPWLPLDDMTGILIHLIDTSGAHGRYDAVAPGIVSNAAFTGAFAAALRRPVIWRVPERLIYGLVGRDRASILIEGQRVIPARTLASGYEFRFPTIETAMDDLVEVTL